MDHGGIGRLVGANRVVFDGFAGAVLHEGDVLVGRGVVNDLGPVELEDLVHAAAVADRSDQGLEVQVRILFLQFQLDIVGIVLIDVKDDQLSGLMGRDLPAELTADRPAAARDQDSLAVDKVKDLRHIGPDRVAAQEVLDRDRLHGRDGDLAQDQLVEAGQVLQFAPGLLADIENVPALGRGRAGDSQVDLFDLVFFSRGQDGVAAAHDGDVINVVVPFFGVVVDDADDLLGDLAGPADIAQDHAAGRAGPDQHDALGGHGLRAARPAVSEQEDEAVGKADPQDKEELQDRTEDIVGDRHASVEPGDQDDMETCRQDRGGCHQDQLRVADKAPDTLVEAESPEDQETENRVEGDKASPGAQVVCRDL